MIRHHEPCAQNAGRSRLFFYSFVFWRRKGERAALTKIFLKLRGERRRRRAAEICPRSTAGRGGGDNMQCLHLTGFHVQGLSPLVYVMTLKWNVPQRRQPLLTDGAICHGHENCLPRVKVHLKHFLSYSLTLTTCRCSMLCCMTVDPSH